VKSIHLHSQANSSISYLFAFANFLRRKLSSFSKEFLKKMAILRRRYFHFSAHFSMLRMSIVAVFLFLIKPQANYEPPHIPQSQDSRKSRSHPRPALYNHLTVGVIGKTCEIQSFFVFIGYCASAHHLSPLRRLSR
jgi:hypothetical protein